MDYTTTYEYSAYSSGSPFGTFLNFAISAATIAGMWMAFKKAGWQGWEALVPFYNIYVMFKIAGLRGVQMLWLLVPFVQLYFFWKAYRGFAAAFGKDGWFTLGLIFLSPIFFLILGFGDAQFVGQPKA